MKRIITCLCATLAFASCTDKQTPFELATAPTLVEWVEPGAYINVQWPNPDTKEVIFPLNVKATGYVKDYDREFFITQVRTYNYWSLYMGLPGESYQDVEGVPFILPAGEMEATVNIKLTYDWLRINGAYNHSMTFRLVFDRSNELLVLDNSQVTLSVSRGPDYGPTLPIPPDTVVTEAYE